MNQLVNIEQVQLQCKKTQSAAKLLGVSSEQKKNEILKSMSDLIEKNRLAILEANKIDLERAEQSGLSRAMIDRLTINETTIRQMQQALNQVANLADPLTSSYPEVVQPSGIKVTKKRIPLGVILMIYESRPNVTVEAAALALKSGNGIILRGGKEAFESNQAIAQCWREALIDNEMSADTVNVLNSTDRQLLDQLLKLDQHIEVVIPRGGEGLIRHVVANSHIPVIKHYKGVCHLYVDEMADLNMAIDILINGKTQRPGVCNALEGLVVHQVIAKQFLQQAFQALHLKDVQMFGCAETIEILPSIDKAREEEFLAEFLDLKISCKVVKNIDQAIDFIDQYGSGHTEVIVTDSQQNADKFVNRVDASVVMVNASSRFSDGGELGLGAEIGISTSKIHAYGPMGLESLTSEKFVVRGNGEVRS